MRDETWNAVEAIFARFPILRAEGVDSIEINGASRELGVPFAADYHEFIRRYGGAIVGPYPIFGLRRAESMGRNDGSVVEVTRRFRQKRWPGTDAWVVISMDHAGNPIGQDKDGKVWISDHDFGGVAVVSDSFEDYLLKRCLKMSGANF